MDYEKEKANAAQEILDYINILPDHALRLWYQDVGDVITITTAKEISKLRELVFRLRRLERAQRAGVNGTFIDPETGCKATFLQVEERPMTQPTRPNTQNERVALWNAAKEMIKKEEDVPPEGMSHYVFMRLRVVYDDPDSWRADDGPGGRGLSWEATLFVDELLKNPGYAPPTKAYR